MDTQSWQRLIEQQPPERQARLFETHISWVLLLGDFAYKVKKPVKFDFIDARDLSTRKEFCEREIELNRRTAPEMYLGVVPVYQAEGLPQLEQGPGEVVDYAVKMKRVDPSLQMDERLQQGQVTRRQVQQLAERVARFHREAEVVYLGNDADYLREEFDALREAIPPLEEVWGADTGSQLQAVIDTAAQHLQRYQGDFERRLRQGWVRDAHGDLHAGNIFLTDPPVVFDCIEFNPELRRIDLLNEVAFMVLSFDFYQAEALKRAFLASYLADMPCLLPEDEPIWDFYLLLRANIKLKVNAFKLAQSRDDQDQYQRQEQRCVRYFDLLRQYHARICKWPEKSIN